MTEPQDREKPTTIVPLLVAFVIFAVMVVTFLVTRGQPEPESEEIPPFPAAVEDFTLTTDPDADAGTYEGPDGTPVLGVEWHPGTSVAEQIDGVPFQASGEWACLVRGSDDEPVCWVDYHGGAVALLTGDVTMADAVAFGDKFLFAWK